MPSMSTEDIAPPTARTCRVGALTSTLTCASVSGSPALADAASPDTPITIAHARTTDRTLIGTSVETVAPHPGGTGCRPPRRQLDELRRRSMAGGLELCGRGTRGTGQGQTAGRATIIRARATC